MPYLRHKPTGDLYISTALLLARTDMEEITDKQAAGVKSAQTREARLALAKEPEAEKPTEKVKTEAKSKAKAKSAVVDALDKGE